MKLTQAMVSRSRTVRARAVGQYADLLRARGCTYRETFEQAEQIFSAAGVPLDLAEFDDLLRESEEV